MNALTKDERIKSDPLACVIVEITAAMKADFGRQYAAQFKSNDDLQLYKRRLYTKLREFEINDIADGYEKYIDSGNTFCPSVPDLVEFSKQSEKSRKKKEQAQKEVSKVAALPSPKKQCDPLQMLADAKKESNGGKSLAEKLQAHQALLTIHSQHIFKHHYDGDKKCAVDFCDKSGSLSSNTKGGGPFYCKEHYRKLG